MSERTEPIRVNYHRHDEPPEVGANAMVGLWQCLHCGEQGYILITDAPDFDTGLDLIHEGQNRIRAEHVC